LLFGKLNLPIESLLQIEEISTTPEEMKKNMDIVDECGNPSNKKRNAKQGRPHYNILIPATASSSDECAAAAEIYDCGQKKAPALTNAIQNNLQTKAATVPVGVRKIYLLSILPDMSPKMIGDQSKRRGHIQNLLQA
jgi:hypothetical protein